MAVLVERQLLFRTAIDDGAPRLLNAKVTQPFEYGLLQKQKFYCISAEIEQPLSKWIAETRYVSFRINKLPDGTETLGAMRGRITGGPPPECDIAKYEPFPELEQLRTKRRLAMGKPA